MSVPNPYHVRVALSQYGDRFRAELFTEDLGDTDGDLTNTDWRVHEQNWPDLLAGGVTLPTDSARDIGKELFTNMLGGPENAGKWQEILAHPSKDDRPIRLLIDATSDNVRNLPFGLLRDSHRNHYLFRPIS